jgi:hypothetical protein
MGRGHSEERTTPSPYWTSVPHTHHTHAMGMPLVPMTMPMHALTYVPMTHAPHGAEPRGLVYADGGQWGSGQHVEADDEHMEGVFGVGAFFTVRWLTAG